MTLVGIVAVLCYLVSSALLGYRLLQSSNTKKTIILSIAALGMVLHGLVVNKEIFTGSGLDLAFFHAGSLITWVMSALLLVATLVRPLENVGIVLFPIAAIGLSFELSFHSHRVMVEPGTLGLELHILFSVLAYGLFSIAAAQAVLLAVQEARLRQKRFGGFLRNFPPLETMEGLLFQIISLGFLMLTLALIKGFAFLRDMSGQHLVHKTALSLIAWLVFAILLWGRYRFGWRGKIAIRWTLTGFIVLGLAYFGSKFVLEFLLVPSS